MLDRVVIKEFLEEMFENMEMEIPSDIDSDVLVETFSKFVEDDLYEWLKDNFKSFFNRGDTNWDWIRERIVHYSVD